MSEFDAYPMPQIADLLDLVGHGSLFHDTGFDHGLLANFPCLRSTLCKVCTYL